MTIIASRDNPRVRRWIRLATDARERRNAGKAIIEGTHLVAACLDSGRALEALILSKSGAERPEIAQLARRAGTAATMVSDRLFASLADAESPAGIAAEIRLPDGDPGLPTASACVFLDGVQDAGNVGAILRSAAAFGIPAAVLGPGCADAWSPKVLRAAMGAHFSISLGTVRDLAAAFGRFDGRIACSVARGGTALGQADLSGRVGWLFGAEGQGVSPALAARAALKVSIPMRASAESLNVAAAAAILFYEASRRAARS